MSLRAVSGADLELQLAKLRESTPDPRVGLFGPSSANWKINRESALFLAAGRAALLQLAHPWIAAAIAQHSRTLNNPILRFHHTFRVMFTMSFGSLEQAFAAARRLHRFHELICGTLPQEVAQFEQGSRYQANEAAALTWVLATLIDSSLVAYDLALPPLPQAERERFYAESRRSAALFGVSPDELPLELNGFHDFMRSVLQSNMLGVTAETRRLADHLRRGTGSPLRPPFWYTALTTQLLPPRVRDEFQLPFRERECVAAERAVRWIRRIYPRLPKSVRFVGPYNEVQARLNGRIRASLPIRFSNKIWLGQPSLFQTEARTSPQQQAA